jgi:ribose transport system permease protein
VTGRFLREYGMLLVLVALCVLFSVATLRRQSPQGIQAAKEIVEILEGRFAKSDVILAVGAVNQDSARFAELVGERLRAAGFINSQTIIGTPLDLRRNLDELAAASKHVKALVTTEQVAKWGVIERLAENYPASKSAELILPPTYVWPDFLKRSNLMAIVDRIVVIAVIAVGMTMVIITGGIDLSVGSLIALSAVVAALVMQRLGGLTAPTWSVPIGFLAGTLSCGAMGVIGGIIIARFQIPPFITTLSVMMIARGLALQVTGGYSIYQLPDALTWLGQGRTLGVPNTVLLLVILYVVAHVFMVHTRFGRYIYAVGGNKEAARLSGVPVGSVIVLVYTASALAAGLGGCIQASQIKTGTPTMGVMFELYVIAAVVLGGTSLSGGSGQVLGTLIGAFIISVIQNGMNLLGIGSYVQQIVLGAVILISVLLDRVRTMGSAIWPFRRSHR